MSNEEILGKLLEKYTVKYCFKFCGMMEDVSRMLYEYDVSNRIIPSEYEYDINWWKEKQATLMKIHYEKNN